MSRTSIDADPFERFLRAPKGESPEEKQARVAQEEEAKRISTEIEDALKADRVAAKKRRAHEVKVLLLGQEASGKTTTLKQFLLNFSGSHVFAEERASWRAIVFLNVITSFKIILQALSSEFESSPDNPQTPDTELDIQIDGRNASFAEIRMRLLPVIHIESGLIRKLNMGAESSEASSNVIGIWPKGNVKEEVAVRGQTWKKAFQSHRHDATKGAASDGIDWDDREDPGVILNASRNEMIALWNNKQVHEVLRRQKIVLEDSGFFLDELDRITARRYIPTDQDVLRARLKTVGAAEHTFSMDSGTERGMDWKIYDVGGTRTQRQSWVPFFDDVDAILFLAPISAFDQMLTEDRRVNRLEDSLALWTELCRNKILAKVPLILFLNKCDLLQSKLKSGVLVKKYVPSYGERKNDFPAASAYFQSKFQAIKDQLTAKDREVFIHLTSMTSRDTMLSIIINVRDVITRFHLKQTNLL